MGIRHAAGRLETARCPGPPALRYARHGGAAEPDHLWRDLPRDLTADGSADAVLNDWRARGSEPASGGVQCRCLQPDAVLLRVVRVRRSARGRARLPART